MGFYVCDLDFGFSLHFVYLFMLPLTTPSTGLARTKRIGNLKSFSHPPAFGVYVSLFTYVSEENIVFCVL